MQLSNPSLKNVNVFMKITKMHFSRALSKFDILAGFGFITMLYRTTSNSTFCSSPLNVLLNSLRALSDTKGQVQKKGVKIF